MQKQSLQGFALGMLFTACIILLVSFNDSDNLEKSSTPFEKEKAIQELEKDGYKVLTSSEWTNVQEKIKDLENKRNEEKMDSDQPSDSESSDSNQEEQTEDPVDEEDEQEQNDSVITYTLSIEAGMNSSNVSQALEDNGIIDDADAFNQYLKDNNMEGMIQIGTYTITSDLSFEVIADIITK